MSHFTVLQQSESYLFLMGSDLRQKEKDVTSETKKDQSVLILPVVLYGYEAWSLTLREEHRLGVSDNRVLGRIFGYNRRIEEVAQ
jgi:hypothetical protein